MIISRLFLFVLFFAGIGAYAQVVAVVGGKKITLKYFNQKYQEVLENHPTPPTKKVFLEDLVRLEQGYQEAERQKLREDKLVKEKIKQELYKVLIDRAIGKKVEAIKVSEKEMKAHYRKYPELRTSHILIEFRSDASKQQILEARKRAQEILAKVKASKRPFPELVKLYTDDLISKTTGGDIGFQSKATLFPTYYSTARKLKKGQISGLVRTRFGFHIIKLTDVQSYKDSNKNQIRQLVFDEKRRVLFNNFFKKLEQKIPTKRYPQRLSSK